VYKEMVLKDEANAPRDLQQLRDLKYRTEDKSATSNIGTMLPMTF
jgi:hypothetical protein